MSVQSDAAKAHLVFLFQGCKVGTWSQEYKFHETRKWRFDFADLDARCAIELDGGTFQGTRTGHSSGTGLRAWREKNNSAMAAGWRVWHYAPEEIIKAGRKTMPDEPILLALPWTAKKSKQVVFGDVL